MPQNDQSNDDRQDYDAQNRSTFQSHLVTPRIRGAVGIFRKGGILPEAVLLKLLRIPGRSGTRLRWVWRMLVMAQITPEFTHG